MPPFAPRSGAPAVTRDDLDILPGWLEQGRRAGPLYRHLTAQAYQYLEQRAADVARLQTAEQWRRRQQAVRATLHDLVGPFPERGPFDPRVVETAGKGGYRVEKVHFQSRPHYYVTGCVFVPDGLKGRAPAILNPIGHTGIAFRSWDYQQLILNLVRKGFIVFPFDPMGQGERLEYYDPEIGDSRIGGPTVEHSYAGNQCFLSGASLARYFTWDGMRAIDYLISRDDVDPERIGVTGISGGGTQTSYIAAFDERVRASSPCCYITGFRRLLQSIGPQDAEQNCLGGVARGIDHADLLEVRAPKPALIASTTRDFFSIQGARESYLEALRAYAAFGQEGSLLMVEDDHTHGYTRKIREATYAFFQRFLEQPGDAAEQEVDYLAPEELTVTETGQVITSLGGETVFSLNRAETERRLIAIEESRSEVSDHLDAVLAPAAGLAGYERVTAVPEAVFAGRFPGDDYSLEKWMIQGEGDYRIPLLLLVPRRAERRQALIYLHPGGKAAAAAEPAVAWLAQQGCLVAMPDLAGIGESTGARGWEHKEAYTALLIGRSLVGIHAGDISRLTRYLLAREDAAPGLAAAVAHGSLCPALLHAAAFDGDIGKVALIEPLASYRSVVANRYYSAAFSSMVPGALTAYDLADLAGALAPRKLLMAGVVDHNGKPLPPAAVEAELEVARRAYAAANAGERLDIRPLRAWQQPEELLGAWLS